eukprot:scaffold16988_cov33-Prasinocladus_malaysianus.AAC.1
MPIHPAFHTIDVSSLQTTTATCQAEPARLRSVELLNCSTKLGFDHVSRALVIPTNLHLMGVHPGFRTW